LLALLTRRGAKRTVSPLVQADAENWLVNGAVSLAVLLAFISILDYLVPYVDPLLVITVVLLFISIPVRMAWQALMELLNRTPPAEILQQVQEAVKACTEHLPVQQLYVRVIQPGQTRMVLAHVVLPGDFQVGGLESLDALRAHTLKVLQKAHLATILDTVFTADPSWGAPFSLGAEAFSL
jgi:predicted Co/Zn/Cd cation transporter (cation efflux family)